MKKCFMKTGLLVVFSAVLFVANAGETDITGSFTGNKAICEGESLTITADFTELDVALQFAFSLDETPIQAQSDENEITLASPTHGQVLRVDIYEYESVSGNYVFAKTETTTIQVNALPELSIDKSRQQFTCDTTSITLSALSANASYLWSSGATTSAIDVTAPDTYSVTVKDLTSGCENTASVSLTENKNIPELSIDKDHQQFTCDTTSIILTALSSNVSYLWSSGATTSSIDVTAPDTYSVTVKDLTSGCENTASVSLTENKNIPELSIDKDHRQFTCDTTSIILTALSSNVSYLWSSGATTSSIDVTAPDTYSVTVKDLTSGCENTASVSLTENKNIPELSIDKDHQQFTCDTTSIALSVQSSNVSYLWSSGATTSSIDVTAPDTYSVTVKDLTSGCENTASVLLTENKNIPEISIVKSRQQFTCDTTSIILTALSSDVSYLWSDGETKISTLTAKRADTYTVTVKDLVTGCENSASITLDANTIHPTLAAIEDYLFCTGTLGDITQTAEEGYEFIYLDADKKLFVNPTAINTDGTFNVSKRDLSNGCYSDTLSFQVTFKPLLPFPALSDVPVCYPELASIVQPAEEGYAYTYYMSDGVSVLANPEAISKTATYYIMKTETATGCISEKNPVSVVVNEQPAILPLETIELCFPLTADIEQPAEPGFSFTYYDTDGTTILSNVSKISVSGTYYITKTNITTGCVSEKTPIVVKINSLPTLKVVDPAYVCTPNTVDIEMAEPGYTFKYYDNTKTEIANANALSVSGTYYITKQDNTTMCISDFVPIKVTVVESPVAFAGDDRVICKNASTELGQKGKAIENYLWKPSANLTNVNIANPSALVVEDVEYTLTVSLKEYPLCTSTDVVKITKSDYPKSLPVTGGGAYCENTPPYDTYVEIENAEDGMEYALYQNGTQYSQWQLPTAGLEVAWTMLESGTYTVQARNGDGCVEKMQNSVFVQKYTHPSASISSSRVDICSGDSIDITIKFFGLAPFTATYKDQYEITHDIVSESAIYTFRVSPTTMGSIWSVVKVSDARCSHIYEIDDRPTVNINVSEEMSAEIVSSDIDNTICFGDIITLEAKVKREELKYKWSTNETDMIINVAPVRDTTIYYLQVSNGLGCTLLDSITIYVNPLPEVDFTGLEILEKDDVCSNDEPLSMTGTPAGGTFSGPNVIGSVYYPNATYARGYDSVMYSYTDERGCTNKKVRYYYVNPSPNVNWYCPVELGPPTKYKSEYEFCRLINDSLNVQGIPSGGYWTLYKEDDNPAQVISLGKGNAYIKDCYPGTYHLRYTYIDDKGCENSMMKRIIVGSEPPSTLLDMGEIMIPDGDTICSRSERVLIVSTRQDGHFETNDPKLIIEQDSLSGQLWINPSLVNSGKYRVMFFKMDYTNCQHYSWKDFYIFSPRNIKALQIPTTYCVTDDSVEVNFEAAFDIVGEAYIIKNTTDTIVNHFNWPNTEKLYFDPEWGVGKYEILLNFQDGYCPNTYRFNIKVLPLPILDVNLPIRDYCYGDTIRFNCLPAGGTYSTASDGLDANMLFTETAGLGTHHIVYTFADTQGGCTDSIEFDVFVHGQAKGTMRILNLNQKYCENAGSTEISGYPIGLGTPYFTAKRYVEDMGDGKAIIHLDKTNYNSNNVVTFNIKEDYIDYYGEIGSCVNSYDQSFRVLSKTVDFFGYADGEEICGTIDSLLLIGSSKVNSHFEIDVAEAASSLENIEDGQAYIYPSKMKEGWYSITYYVDYYEESEDEIFCTVQKTKRFYIKPLKEFKPRIICSENNNTFVIENTESDVQYDLWTNGVLFQSLMGNGGTITFNPITERAYCHFYASRGDCKRTYPDEILVEPITLSVDSHSISCYGMSDGEIDVESKGGNGVISYIWTDGADFAAAEANIKHLTAGTYTVLATDSIGCTATKSVEITEPTQINIEIVEQKALSCYDAADAAISVMAKGGTEPYTYSWKESGTSEIISITGTLANVPAGVYEVLATDYNNCSTTQTFAVLDKTPVEVKLLNLENVEIYGEKTGKIELDVTGGVAPYTFEWNAIDLDDTQVNNQNLENLSAGTYFLTIRDNNDCRLDTMFVVTQPERLKVKFTKSDVSCFGGQDGFVALEVEGGVEPYSYNWTNEGVTFSTERDATRLSAGIYSVVVTDAAGSVFSNSFKILEADELTLIVSGRTKTELACYGDNTGILSVEPRGGTTPYTYEWIGDGVPDDQKDKATLSGITAGTYRVVVKDSHNCRISDDFEITQPEKLKVLDYIVTEPTCNGREDAAIEIFPTGGVEPYEFYWEGNNVLPYEQNQTGIKGGSYAVTLIDANGCEDKTEIEVNEPQYLMISMQGESNICKGSSVNLKFSMNVSREWTIEFIDGNNNYTINTTESSYTYPVTPDESTVYALLEARDKNGCVAEIQNKTVAVNVHSVPEITLPDTEFNICEGESANVEYFLNGESPWEIRISNGDWIYRKGDIDMGEGYFSISPEKTTTYNVERVSSPYCHSDVNIPLTVNVQPRSTLSAKTVNQTICKGESSQIEISLTGLAPWHIYYTEAGVEKIVTVTESPYLLPVDIEETTRFIFTKVESDGGCITPVSADIQIAVLNLPGDPQIITGKTEVCGGKKERYFVPTIPYATRYNWTVPEGARIVNGEGSSQILVEFTDNAKSGFITVSAENECGKGNSTSLFVTPIGAVGKGVQILAPDEICISNELQYIGTVAIPNAEHYEWSLPYGFVIEDGDESADLLVSLKPDAVSGTITVMGKNQCNIGEPISKEIKIRPMPIVEAGPDIYTNCKNYAELNASSAAPYKGSWSVAEGKAKFEDIYDPQTKVTELGLGENLLVWKVDNGLCTKTDTLRVYNNSADKATVEITDVYNTCENEVVLRATEPQIGTGKWECVQGNASVENENSNIAVASNLDFGKNIFRWTTYNGHCEDYTLVNIYTNSPAKYAFAGRADTVFVTDYRLNAAKPVDGITGEWSIIAGDNVQIADKSSYTTDVSNLSVGRNVFRWTVSSKECTVYSEVTILYVREPIALFVTDVDGGCPPLDLNMTNSTIGQADFEWDFGDGETSDLYNPRHIFENPGTYEIILTARGELKTDVYKKKITVYERPVIDISVMQDTVYMPQAPLFVINNSEEGRNYFWEFGNGDTSTDRVPKYSYKEGGLYDIFYRMENLNGCVDSTKIEQAVLVREEAFVTFPNAFIPNKSEANGGEYSLEDRNHDVFYPVSLGVIEYSLQIFNRWGEEIFSTDDINVGWDGYLDGKLCPSGEYVYKSSGKFFDGRNFTRKGEVLLIQ